MHKLNINKAKKRGLKIIIKNLQKKIPINQERIKKIILDTLSFEGVKKPGEITICFVNDKGIRELNLMYRGQDNPTDVLSFDISQKPKKEILADIAVSTDTAGRNARIFKTTPYFELYLYVIHGLLHLLGYADKNARQRCIMEEKTNQILARIINH